MSGVFKKTTLAILLSACLVVLLFFAVQNAMESHLVRKWIQSKINLSLPGDISWKSTRLSLIRGRFALEDMTVSEPSGKTVLSLDRLFVNLDWPALFSGSLNFRELNIENPRFHLQRDRDGSLDLLRAFSSGGKKQTSVASPQDFSLPFNLVVKALKLSGGALSYEDAEGKTSVHASGLEVSAEGNFNDRKGKIVFSFASGPLKIGNMVVQSGKWRLSGSYERDRISNLILNADFPGLSATLEGAVENLQAAPKIQAELQIQGSPGELSRMFGLKGEFSGDSLVKASVSGPLSNPEARLHLDCKAGVLAGQPVDRVQMVLSLKDRVATLHDLQILAAGGESHIRGVMNLQKAFPGGFFSPGADSGKIFHDYEVVVKNLQMANLVKSGTLLEGELGARAKITGKGLNPSNITGSAEFSVAGENLKMDRIKARDRMVVQGKIDLEPGAKVSANLSGTSTGIALKASGEMGIKTQLISAKIAAKAEDLGLVAAMAGIANGGGNFSLQADLSGSMKKPVFNLSLSAKGLTAEKISLDNLDLAIRSRPGALKNGPDMDVSLSGKGIAISGVRRLDGIETRGSLSKGMLHIQQADFIRGRSLVKITGAVRLLEPDSLQRVKRPSGRLELSSKDFHLEDFVENTRGSFTIQSVVEGHPKDFKGFVQVQGEKILIRNQSIESISLNGELVKDRLVLAPLLLVARNQKLRVEGWVATDKTFQLKTNVDQSSLEPWFAGLNHPEFSGNVTGSLEISGTAGNAVSYGGRLALSRLSVFYHRQPLVNARQVLVLLENRRVELKNLQLLFEGDRELKVTGGISLEGESDVRVSGRFPLSILRIFNENFHDISGEMRLDGSMAGPLSEPAIHGDIQVMDLQTMVPGITQKVHNTRGRVIVSPEAVNFESITGQLDSGTFEFTGQIDLDHFKPVGISGALKSYRLPVSIPDTLDMTLNTDLKIRGDFENSTIEGALVLLEGLYYKDVNLNPIIAMSGAKPRSGRRAESPKPTLADGMALNIFVRNRSPLVVSNNVSEMEIVPDLKIKGTLSRPIVLGRAHVESGQLMYRKRTFEIKKGIIDFLNPYKTEPSLDIQGESRIRDWLVTLNLSGTPDELLFSFSSDPPLDEGDIFSLVVLGKTSGEMTGGDSLSNQSAAQMLSRIMASSLNEDLQKAMGLDILETEVLEEQDGNGANEMKVTVGKEINRRLTMKYSARTEDGQIVQRTIAEYKFIENILVNVFQGTRGVLGGSIKYRLEWR